MVSVIIPTYNRVAYLEAAVLSVYQQTYRPIECIVVDDGSTDATKNLMDQLSIHNKHDFQIRYIYQDNAGAQIARNKGTESATGEYIQYLDSDDLLYPDKLMQQVHFLRDHPDCDGVFGDWEKGVPENKECIKGYCSDHLISQMLTERCIHTLSFLFRKEVYEKAGGWDPAIKRNQEIDFHIRALLNGSRFSYLPGITGLWRTHDGIRIANSTDLSDVIFFFQKTENLLEKSQLLTEDIKIKIAALYMWFVTENLSQSNRLLSLVLIEAVRLNPGIKFRNNFLFRSAETLMGLRNTILCWLWVRKLGFYN